MGGVFLAVEDDENQLCYVGHAVIAEPHGRGHKSHGDQTEREQSRKGIQPYILSEGGSDDGADAFYHEGKHTHDGNDEAVHKETVHEIGGMGIRRVVGSYLTGNFRCDEIPPADKSNEKSDDGGEFAFQAFHGVTFLSNILWACSITKFYFVGESGMNRSRFGINGCAVGSHLYKTPKSLKPYRLLKKV